jgi:hypothetical protein
VVKAKSRELSVECHQMVDAIPPWALVPLSNHVTVVDETIRTVRFLSGPLPRSPNAIQQDDLHSRTGHTNGAQRGLRLNDDRIRALPRHTTSH